MRNRIGIRDLLLGMALGLVLTSSLLAESFGGIDFLGKNVLKWESNSTPIGIMASHWDAFLIAYKSCRGLQKKCWIKSESGKYFSVEDNSSYYQSSIVVGGLDQFKGYRGRLFVGEAYLEGEDEKTTKSAVQNMALVAGIEECRIAGYYFCFPELPDDFSGAHGNQNWVDRKFHASSKIVVYGYHVLKFSEPLPIDLSAFRDAIR